MNSFWDSLPGSLVPSAPRQARAINPDGHSFSLLQRSRRSLDTRRARYSTNHYVLMTLGHLALCLSLLPSLQGHAPPVDALPPSAQDSAVPLDALVRVALEHNLQLLAARTREPDARASVLGSLAAFDHNVSTGLTRNSQEEQPTGDPSRLADTYSLGVSYSKRMPFSGEASLAIQSRRQSLSPRDFNAATIPTSPFFTTLTKLSYRQPLMRGFGRAAFAGVESARRGEESARLEIRRAAEETIASVENAYWSLLTAQTLERVAEQSVALADSIAQRTRDRFELDLAVALDVATAERALAQRRATLVDSRRQRRDAMEDLVYLVYGEDAAGLLEDGFAIRAASASRRQPDLMPVDALMEVALERRPDLAGARYRVEAQEVLHSQARNSLLPSLDVVGSLGVGGAGSSFGPVDFEGAHGTDQTQWSLGLQVSYPLANRQARAAELQQRASVRRQQWELAGVVADVTRQVSAAVRAVESGEERLELARRAQTFSEEEFEAALTARRLDVISTFQLFQVEEELLRARQGAAQALSEYLSAVTALELALGRVDDDYTLPGWLAHP